MALSTVITQQYDVDITVMLYFSLCKKETHSKVIMSIFCATGLSGFDCLVLPYSLIQKKGRDKNEVNYQSFTFISEYSLHYSPDTEVYVSQWVTGTRQTVLPLVVSHQVYMFSTHHFCARNRVRDPASYPGRPKIY
jgi:hypothetical protein